MPLYKLGCKQACRGRHMLLASLLLLLGTGCTEQTANLFEAPYEVRTAQANQKIQQVLTAPKEGWLGYYSSTRIGGSPIVMQFDDKGKVKIKAYPISFTGFEGETSTSSYELYTTQTHNIEFEGTSIFTYWHNLQSTNGRPLRGGEFQFSVESYAPEKVVLKSLKDVGNPTRLVLKPASPADWTMDPVGIQQMDSLYVGNAPILSSQGYFRNLEIPEYDFKALFQYFPGTRAGYFTYTVGDSVHLSRHRIGISERGFSLIDPLTVAPDVELSEFVFNLGQKKFFPVGFANAQLKNSNTPVLEYFPTVDRWGFQGFHQIESRMEYSTRNAFVNYVSPEFYDLVGKIGREDRLQNFKFYVHNKSIRPFTIDRVEKHIVDGVEQDTIYRSLKPVAWESAISLSYNASTDKGLRTINIDIPVTLVRNQSKTLIFKLEEKHKDLSQFYDQRDPAVANLHVPLAEDLIKVLTDKEGFYPIQTTLYTQDRQAYQAVMLVGKTNPKMRFITELIDQEPVNRN